MNEIATRATQKNYEIVKHGIIKHKVFFTQLQFEKILRGYIPKQMEDRWFIYCEDYRIYVHRSWTGYGIYEAKLNPVPNGCEINFFWVETQPERYNSSYDGAEIVHFLSIIQSFLIGGEYSLIDGVTHFVGTPDTTVYKTIYW